MMYLFVWDDNVLVDWSAGIMFAYASDLESARQLLRDLNVLPEEDIMKTPKVFDLPHADFCWGSA